MKDAELISHRTANTTASDKGLSCALIDTCTPATVKAVGPTIIGSAAATTAIIVRASSPRLNQTAAVGRETSTICRGAANNPAMATMTATRPGMSSPSGLHQLDGVFQSISGSAAVNRATTSALKCLISSTDRDNPI